VSGGTALSAGAVLLPNSLAWSAAAAIAGPLVRPVGYRRMCLAGFGFLLAAGLLLIRLDARSSLAEVAFAGSVAGLASGILSPTLLLAIQNAVDPNQLGVATSLAMFLRNIGYSVGVSVMGAVLAGGLAARLNGAVPDPGALLVAGTSAALDPALGALFRASLAAAMHDVFLLSVVITTIGLAAALRMTGWKEAAGA
jgi:MFS family permease